MSEIVDVVVPRWGMTMEEAHLVEWRKAVGDPVAEGEALVEVEADKIEGEIESPVSGILTEIVVEADQTVAVGGVIARITQA